MDGVNLVFYAVVCGLLSFASPWMGKFYARFIAGALVGVVAAYSLPILKGIFLN